MNILPDNIRENIHEYQVQHIHDLNNILSNHHIAADTSDTGTGKTYTSCALAKWRNKKVFVVCPKSVIESWFNVASMMECEILGVANYEAIKLRKYYNTLDNFQTGKRQQCEFIDNDYNWFLTNNSMLIFDEVHKGKNSSTMNSKLLMASRKLLLVDNANNNAIDILLLSATIIDRVDCFHLLAYLLGLSQEGKHAYNAWIRILKRRNPEKDIVEIFHSIIYPNYACRMKIREIISQHNDFFKKNDVKAETYIMSKQVAEQISESYEEINRALLAINTNNDDCVLTVILRARQRIEILKVPAIVKLAEYYLENNNSVAIFINFDQTRKELITQLTKNYQMKPEQVNTIAVICGRQSPKERSKNIQMFQSGESKIIIANIHAGGVGVSLHGHNRVSLISPTWSSIELKQTLGRIYRAGGDDVIQRIIYCKNSDDAVNVDEFGKKKRCIEELIAENVNKKLKTIEWLNNGNGEDLITI